MRMQYGYDDSHYFISAFVQDMQDHIDLHAILFLLKPTSNKRAWIIRIGFHTKQFASANK